MTSHSGFLSQFEQFIGSSNKQEGKLKKYSKKSKVSHGRHEYKNE